MPKVIIQAEPGGRVTLSERVVAANLDSAHYAAQLLERLAWATADAESVESEPAPRPAVRVAAPSANRTHLVTSALLLVIMGVLALAPAALARTRHRHAPTGAGQADTASRVIAAHWYDITTQTIAAASFPEPVTQSRAWAVSWLAASRAVRYGGNRSYTVAAFAQALHDTLAAQIPTQRPQLDSDLASTLAGVPDGRAKSTGIAAGRGQAAAALAERRGDGLDTSSLDVPFTPPAAVPGAWQPTPPTFAPAVRAGQGHATPFLLTTADQFDPGPPPSLTSPTYLTDLAEVRAYGSSASAVRTPQETDVALFWEPAINVQYVQLLRAILTDTRRPLAWQARFVAAFNVITTDAQIAIYNAKFKYVFWRPVTAIRTGLVDPDPTWTPLFTTPRYPDWPSGHGGVAGAAQQVLTAFLGRQAPAPIELSSPTDPGSIHTFDLWTQITREVIDARVWEGIHYRFSDVVDARVGERVARYDLLHLPSIGL